MLQFCMRLHGGIALGVGSDLAGQRWASAVGLASKALRGLSVFVHTLP